MDSIRLSIYGHLRKSLRHT